MISPTAEYALRAVVALAQNDGHAVVTPRLAELTRVSAPYLAKVMQILARNGLVTSQRGTGGGFRLARLPGQISVLEVINAVEPVQRIRQCPLEIESHGQHLCPLHKRLDEVAEWTEHAYAGTCLEDLLAAHSGATPLCPSQG